MTISLIKAERLKMFVGRLLVLFCLAFHLQNLSIKCFFIKMISPSDLMQPCRFEWNKPILLKAAKTDNFGNILLTKIFSGNHLKEK